MPDNTAGDYYTAMFGGTSHGTQGNVVLKDSSSNPANFTVGGLILRQFVYALHHRLPGIRQPDVGQRRQSGGPSVMVASSAIEPFISANLILADSVSRSTTFNIVVGEQLDVNGPISESMTYTGQSITLTGGGTLYFDATNSYTGSTTVNDGSVLYVGFDVSPRRSATAPARWPSTTPARP